MIVSEPGRLGYAEGLALQFEARARVAAGGEDELLLLEHEAVVTLGRRGGDVDARDLSRLGVPVVQTDRGGLATWHGPGQLTGYAIVDLRRARVDVSAFVCRLGALMRGVASDFGVDAAFNPERPGLYVQGRKLGSIGLHIHRGLTTHGFALNVDCDLEGFDAIVPCGARGLEMTTLRREAAGGQAPTMGLVTGRCRELAATLLTPATAPCAR